MVKKKECVKQDKLSESNVCKTNKKHLVVCCVAIRLEWTNIILHALLVANYLK